MPDETTLLADECAAEARAWLTTVADIASGVAPESAIPLLLLTTSQIQLVGARLGAIADVVLEQRFEDDPGPDTEIDPLRTGLAHLLDGVDEYVDLVDPVTSPETAGGALSNDLAIIAAALAHGLAHHDAGRATEALWWWQYSYLADWGDRAAMAVRVLQTLLAHLRLDADADVVGEAEFDALNS
ncbi:MULTISPECIES: DUF5063 domain-containing protein [Janibacter]|uniref:DUF5063 domain-containing protein n=1 Tax=Janibacter TaxID=53457 RepID=UPI000836738E|nr:DUF5063 domain-containing protein [Janibacter terrae]MBA4085105.1 DUF5063 domain-containing protein [Kytococcus sp.]HBO53914.1 DUF5063 domain-containing protein [Janibacter terrae]